MLILRPRTLLVCRQINRGRDTYGRAVSWMLPSASFICGAMAPISGCLSMKSIMPESEVSIMQSEFMMAI